MVCELPITKPSSKQRCSISLLVATALSEMPPPMHFERTRKSGTMPSCSKPKIEPRRPGAVWASSRITNMPRSRVRRASSWNH